MQKMKNKIPVRHACAADPDNSNGGGGGGVGGGWGGGGGCRIASRERFVPVFLLGNKWQLMIFMGRSGPPAPSVSAHIRVPNSLNSHYITFFPVRHACADPDNCNGGGGGGGGRIASRGRFVPFFLLGNKWQLMIFMGRSGPSVPAHIRVSNSLDSHFIYFSCQICVRGSRQFQRGGGGGGGGGDEGRIASRGRFVPVFLRGNKWQLMIFMGRSGPPAPSPRPYQSFKQFEIYFCWAWSIHKTSANYIS